MGSIRSVLHSRFLFAGVLALLILLMVQTPPSKAIADETSWSFAFLADSRSKRKQNFAVNVKALNLIAHEIARDIRDSNVNCELVLFGGDLIKGQYAENTTQTNLEQFQEWKQAMKPVYNAFHVKDPQSVPLYVVRGNHEIYTKKSGVTAEQVLQDWMAAFGKDMPQNGPPPPTIEHPQVSPQKGLNYFVKHKNVLFVAVDQYVEPGVDPSINLEWLNKTLKEQKTGPHAVVFGHAPAWPAVRTRNDKSLFDYPGLSQKFWQSIEAGGCRVYLTGHQHYTAVNLIRTQGKPDMWQIMSGSAGAPLTKGKLEIVDPGNTPYVNNTDFGYYLCEVKGQSMTLRFKRYSPFDKRWKSDDASVVKYSID